LDLCGGKGSVVSSSSGSHNTSLDDWSDSSDESFDFEEDDALQDLAAIGEEWLVTEFKVPA